MKPKLFIGSSVEGLKIAENLKIKLDYDFDVDLWNEGVFNLGNTTIDDLLDKLRDSDFGLFVFSFDDKSIMREKNVSVVRDNVLYELGLYTGKLGRKNTFVVTSSDLPEDFHLLTDLMGVNFGKYDAAKMESNPESAVSTFCTKLKNQIFNKSKYPLSGKWIFTWEAENSENYKDLVSDEVDVFHYENTLKFIHTAKPGDQYIVKGELSHRYFTGQFEGMYASGYHGALQMLSNGQNTSFEGRFVGWQNSGVIGSGPCSLKRVKP